MEPLQHIIDTYRHRKSRSYALIERMLRTYLRPYLWLLHFLAQNPDRVLSRGDLIAALGKQEPPIDKRTVDVWIGRLRRALRKVGAGERVRTVRSLGYVYDSYD